MSEPPMKIQPGLVQAPCAPATLPEMPPETLPEPVSETLPSQRRGAVFLARWKTEVVRMHGVAGDFDAQAHALADEMVADATALLVSTRGRIQEGGVPATLASLREALENFGDRWQQLLDAWTRRQLVEWQCVLRDELASEVLAETGDGDGDQTATLYQTLHQEHWLRHVLSPSPERRTPDD